MANFKEHPETDLFDEEEGCSKILVKELRAGFLDTVIRGDIAVVGDSGLLFYLGNPYKQAFYRSAAKPIQTLPFLGLGLHERYGFTKSEIALMAASHLGEPVHIATAEAMMQKNGFTEDDMIMGKTYPHSRSEMKRLAVLGAPKRRIYHNCSGKHIAMLCIAKELGDLPSSYSRIDSAMGKISLDYLSEFCDIPTDEIGIGVDGCGVPVFRVPLLNMALSYKRLADPEQIKNPVIAKAAQVMIDAYHSAPYIVRGKNTLCEALNSDKNLIGKLGAGGVYCIGLTKEKLGIAIKTEDGNLDCLDMVVRQVLCELGYNNAELFLALDKIIDTTIKNDSGAVVGELSCSFKLSAVN